MTSIYLFPTIRDGVPVFSGRFKSLRAYMARKSSFRFDTGCIEWIAGKDWDGYGMGYAFKRQWRAHRLSYFLFNGDPTGFQVLHSCDNPPCINPAHLFLGTPKTNVEDCQKKGRRGLPPAGELNGQHKLTEGQVIAIRARYKPYSKTDNMYVIAKDFGVHVVTIWEIIHRKKWKAL